MQRSKGFVNISTVCFSCFRRQIDFFYSLPTFYGLGNTYKSNYTKTNVQILLNMFKKNLFVMEDIASNIYDKYDKMLFNS